jgi:hypothetical protein
LAVARAPATQLMGSPRYSSGVVRQALWGSITETTRGGMQESTHCLTRCSSSSSSAKVPSPVFEMVVHVMADSGWWRL